MGDGGEFGRWGSDALGLPSFVVNGDLRDRAGLVLPGGDVRRLWHQVGNDRITATAHADGTLTLYWFEEGPIDWSNRPELVPIVQTLKIDLQPKP